MREEAHGFLVCAGLFCCKSLTLHHKSLNNLKWFQQAAMAKKLVGWTVGVTLTSVCLQAYMGLPEMPGLFSGGPHNQDGTTWDLDFQPRRVWGFFVPGGGLVLPSWGRGCWEVSVGGRLVSSFKAL